MEAMVVASVVRGILVLYRTLTQINLGGRKVGRDLLGELPDPFREHEGSALNVRRVRPGMDLVREGSFLTKPDHVHLVHGGYGCTQRTLVPGVVFTTD